MGGIENINPIPKILNSLSLSELTLLRSAITSPDKRTALIGVIDSLIAFHKPYAEQPVEISTDLRNAASSDERLVEDDHRAFMLVLSDPQAFKSTRDVVEAVNAAFGLRLKSSDHVKRGRSSVIDKAWRFFETLPRAERARAMNKIVHQMPDKSNSEYLRLFRFLTRDER